MTDETREGKSSYAWVFIGLALLVLYPLSAGPMVWLHENFYLDASGQVVETVYAPLKFIADNNKQVKMFLDWYLDFWR